MWRDTLSGLVIGGIVLVYFGVAVLVSFWVTRQLYINEITKPWVPPKRGPGKETIYSGRKLGDEYTEQQLDVMETERREQIAKRAIRVGVAYGSLWIFTIPRSLWQTSFRWFTGCLKRYAIDPANEERNRELQYKKAKEIVRGYEQEKREEFMRELSEQRGIRK